MLLRGLDSLGEKMFKAMVKAIGLSCCDNIAPMATPEASVVRSKGLVKSGRARVMREAIASFNLEKAVATRGFHLKEGCLRRSGLENKLEMLIVLLHGGAVNQDVVKKTKTNLRSTDQKRSFIADWNVDGAFVSPNGITRNS
nr:hypothetical protein [Tanacetum cinerariifolium]